MGSPAARKAPPPAGGVHMIIEPQAKDAHSGSARPSMTVCPPGSAHGKRPTGKVASGICQWRPNERDETSKAPPPNAHGPSRSIGAWRQDSALTPPVMAKSVLSIRPDGDAARPSLMSVGDVPPRTRPRCGCACRSAARTCQGGGAAAASKLRPWNAGRRRPRPRPAPCPVAWGPAGSRSSPNRSGMVGNPGAAALPSPWSMPSVHRPVRIQSAMPSGRFRQRSGPIPTAADPAGSTARAAMPLRDRDVQPPPRRRCGSAESPGILPLAPSALSASSDLFLCAECLRAGLAWAIAVGRAEC